MEQLAEFLRQMGYTVTKGGTEHFSSEFLAILKEAQPIGFILADYSALTTSDETRKLLSDLAAFWKANSKAPGRGKSEFLILYWKENEITTNFDVQAGQELYNLYLHGKNVEQFQSLDEAMEKLDKECPITYKRIITVKQKEQPQLEKTSEPTEAPKENVPKKRLSFWRKEKISADSEAHEVAT